MLKTESAASMKPKIHKPKSSLRNAAGKTPGLHQQEKRDRLGVMIVFALFFGTLLYVLIEYYFT